MTMAKQNWFETLREALRAERIEHLWPISRNIQYGENADVLVEDSKGFRRISIYRSDTTGRYERPVHYRT
jgi:hypothetical protein